MGGLDHCQAIGEGGAAGFADEAEHLKACDGRCALHCLPLSEVEVCGDGDDSSGDGVVEERFGRFLEVVQDHRQNIVGRL